MIRIDPSGPAATCISRVEPSAWGSWRRSAELATQVNGS